MSRLERWSEVVPGELVAGAVMLDPVTGCEVTIRRVEAQEGGALIEYEPGPAGVGLLATAGQLIRTRKVEQDE